MQILVDESYQFIIYFHYFFFCHSSPNIQHFRGECSFFFRVTPFLLSCVILGFWMIGHVDHSEWTYLQWFTIWVSLYIYKHIQSLYFYLFPFAIFSQLIQEPGGTSQNFLLNLVDLGPSISRCSPLHCVSPILIVISQLQIIYYLKSITHQFIRGRYRDFSRHLRIINILSYHFCVFQQFL